MRSAVFVKLCLTFLCGFAFRRHCEPEAKQSMGRGWLPGLPSLRSQ
jgi:hypothetical protein